MRYCHGGIAQRADTAYLALYVSIDGSKRRVNVPTQGVQCCSTGHALAATL